jgi:hypothetical protein
VVQGRPTPGARGWGPQRIVCLTEETTEWLYLLGEQARIVGISGYTVRPRRARQEKPRVSAFLSAKIDKPSWRWSRTACSASPTCRPTSRAR